MGLWETLRPLDRTPGVPGYFPSKIGYVDTLCDLWKQSYKFSLASLCGIPLRLLATQLSYNGRYLSLAGQVLCHVESTSQMTAQLMQSIRHVSWSGLIVCLGNVIVLCASEIDPWLSCRPGGGFHCHNSDASLSTGISAGWRRNIHMDSTLGILYDMIWYMIKTDRHLQIPFFSLMASLMDGKHFNSLAV